MTQSSTTSGLTVIEMILSVLIITLLLSIGIPLIGNIQQTAKVEGLAHDLFADLKLLRNEAVVHNGATLVLCASSNGIDCNSVFWETGWISFFDPNKDGALTPAKGEERLRVRQYQLRSNTIRTTGLKRPGIVTFNAQGKTDETGIWTFCDTRGNDKAKAVVLMASGQALIADNEEALSKQLGQPIKLSCPFTGR